MLVGGAYSWRVRQTMIIGADLWAVAVTHRRHPGCLPSMALVGAGLWILLSRGLPSRARRNATIVFAVMCLAQAALYAFHRFAEARMLPNAELLDAATEPYGPDGIFGAYISLLTFVMPAGAGLITAFLDRARKPFALSGAAFGLAGLLVTVAAGRATPMSDRLAHVTRHAPVPPPASRRRPRRTSSRQPHGR